MLSPRIKTVNEAESLQKPGKMDLPCRTTTAHCSEVHPFLYGSIRGSQGRRRRHRPYISISIYISTGQSARYTIWQLANLQYCNVSESNLRSSVTDDQVDEYITILVNVCRGLFEVRPRTAEAGSTHSSFRDLLLRDGLVSKDETPLGIACGTYLLFDA